MASPTLEGSDISDYQQAEASEEDIRDWLVNRTPAERVLFLRKEFRGRVQPIQDMATPVLCNTYPDFEDDILTAYLQQITFTLKVWVNYDAACKKFYTDRRVEDCGKLVLSPKDRQYLKGIMAQKLEVNRVILEVGTAFNTLCHIALRADPRNRQLIARCKPQTGEHPELIEFLRGVCDILNNSHVPKGQSGLLLEDVGEVSTMLLREPNPADKVYINRWNVRDPWMDLDGRKPNPGWLDFDALGKGESGFGSTWWNF